MNWTQRDGRRIARDDRARRRAPARPPRACASRASRLASLRSRRFDGARSVIEKRHTVKPRNEQRRATTAQMRLNSKVPRQVDQPAVHLALGPIARRFAASAPLPSGSHRANVVAIFDLLADDAGGDEIAHHQQRPRRYRPPSSSAARSPARTAARWSGRCWGARRSRNSRRNKTSFCGPTVSGIDPRHRSSPPPCRAEPRDSRARR